MRPLDPVIQVLMDNHRANMQSLEIFADLVDCQLEIMAKNLGLERSHRLAWRPIVGAHMAPKEMTFEFLLGMMTKFQFYADCIEKGLP